MHQLLVEHHEADHDSGWDRYVTRYFVSYPFCGVKWFKKPPSEIDQQIPRETKELNNDNEGWLYGGDVSIVQIDTLPGYKQERSVVVHVLRWCDNAMSLR